MELLIEQALATFHSQFPLVRVQTEGYALRYTLRSGARGKFYEDFANRLILANNLPLEANLLEWSTPRRGMFETVLEIKVVRAMSEIHGY